MEYEHNLVSIPPEINTAFEEDEEEEGEEDEEDEEVRLSEVKPSVEQHIHRGNVVDETCCIPNCNQKDWSLHTMKSSLLLVHPMDRPPHPHILPEVIVVVVAVVVEGKFYEHR